MLTGPERFARYAYPPNLLGYCGPDGMSVDELVDAPAGDLRHWATGFEGAWPYLSLIAETTGLGDPLHPRVVEAYWLGSSLLSDVPLLDFGTSLRDRFRARNPGAWPDLASQLVERAVPHHSFHVFCVYPWVGLLRAGHRDIALGVLDQCRIRVGNVVSSEPGLVHVATDTIVYREGRVVRNAEPTVVTASVALGEVANGDWVTIHWDWVCERTDAAAAARLRAIESRHLHAANLVPVSIHA